MLSSPGPTAMGEPHAPFPERAIVPPRYAQSVGAPPRGSRPFRPVAPPSRPPVPARPPVASVGDAVEAPRPAPLSATFHGAVSAFKRRLIETTLTELGGNRTRAARALGLQRTYLLRLMREFEVDVPATPGHPRRNPEAQSGAPCVRSP